jgi:hypothetical protein
MPKNVCKYWNCCSKNERVWHHIRRTADRSFCSLDTNLLATLSFLSKGAVSWETYFIFGINIQLRVCPWMSSSLVVRASGCQCQSRNSPGFDPGILGHSGIWGAADKAVLNNVHNIVQKIPLLQFRVCLSKDRCWFWINQRSCILKRC